MQNKFGSTSTNGLSQVPANQQLQTYIDHCGGKWVGKKRDFDADWLRKNKIF